MWQFLVVLLIVALLALVGGLARLFWESPPVEPVNMDRAREWARCFAPAEIPAGKAVTLLSLTSHEPPPSQQASLDFVPTEPIKLAQ